MKTRHNANTSKAHGPANTTAELSKKSSESRDGNSVQLLGPVAPLPSTLIDKEFWQNDGETRIYALLAMYKSLLDNTFSGDARFLSIHRAISILSPHLGEEKATQAVQEVFERVKRTGSPLDGMF